MKFTRREFIRKSAETGLVLGLGTSGGISLYQLVRDYPNSKILISSHELKVLTDQTDQVRTVDARGPVDYKKEHIKNAVNIWDREMNTWTKGVPRMKIEKDSAEKLMRSMGISNSTTVVIYGEAGNLWSARLFWIMEYYGHSRLKVLNGGIKNWKEQGGGLTQVVPSFSSRKFSARPDPHKLATGGWLKGQLDNHQVKIVDTRSKLEYQGIDIRARKGGHIPGALHIPWQGTIASDGTFQSYNHLRLIYQQAGLKKGDTIVTYSQTGVQAAHGYFALRLMGYPDVRVYDGSWAEWGNLEGFPIKGGREEQRPPQEGGSLCW